ncbi:conserved exported hypothetical protein [Desulfosarcina cetonica]|nr:conserved exported hypothetical protein [Desulfosarcina cetonica]
MNWRLIAMATIWVVLSSIPLGMAAPPPAAGNTVAAPVEAAPAAKIPQTEAQFEPVVEGTEVTEDFVVKNEGDGILEIHQVKTG